MNIQGQAALVTGGASAAELNTEGEGDGLALLHPGAAAVRHDDHPAVAGARREVDRLHGVLAHHQRHGRLDGFGQAEGLGVLNLQLGVEALLFADRPGQADRRAGAEVKLTTAADHAVDEHMVEAVARRQAHTLEALLLGHAVDDEGGLGGQHADL